MLKDYSDYVREQVKKHKEIHFTKTKQLKWLEKRNNCTLEHMKQEIFSLKDLQFTDKQQSEYMGKKEVRYRCYFVYSGSRGRCYVLKFNSVIKVITAFPLGRTTLRKYKKRFK